MPTFEVRPRCRRDFERLTPEQQRAFLKPVARFVEDLRQGSFRKGLRVKAVKAAPGIFEMTWAPDGRATFQFGEPKRPGEPHVIWRRCGTHAILQEP